MDISLLGVDQEIERHRRTLERDGENAPALAALGALFARKGELGKAIGCYRHATEVSPGTASYWRDFAALLSSLAFSAYNEDVAVCYLKLLGQKAILRPVNLVRAVIAFVKQHPAMRAAFDAAEAGKLRAEASMHARALAQIPLLLRMMELCPIPDAQAEHVFTELRRGLLENRASLTGEELPFQISLALHCFTNEYVFDETEEETRAVEVLARECAARPTAQALACLASYRPLHLFAWARDISAPKLEALITRQVREPEEERSLMAGIPALGEIIDETSSKVRAQYEENPYPRWIHTALVKASSIGDMVRELGLDVPSGARFADKPDILIAGCGTGQHALAVASRFAHSKVLAADLSRASLAYALRKTRELGVTNIQYMQADILEMEKLGRTFDIVESVGVLHHMAEPMAGWKILAGRLRPGGLMRIGLYSESARKDVVIARAAIAERGADASPASIRAVRRAILSGDPAFAQARTLLQSSGLYSMSECRDLLFHVQEHRFRLAQIDAALKELGLRFIGFEMSDPDVLAEFREAHRDPGALYSLKVWNRFEAMHPTAFSGMYQFWAQKNG